VLRSLGVENNSTTGTRPQSDASSTKDGDLIGTSDACQQSPRKKSKTKTSLSKYVDMIELD